LTAYEDIYFLKKEYRKGRIGLKMFQFAEKLLKEQGVQRIIYNTKVHSDNSSLFEYLGFKFIDKVFSKML
jgi:N-acetylglutamate synthase-like GNAT family acetyltransferase